MTDTDATYLSPLLDLGGAVQAEAPDAGVAVHYGQPVVEQRRLLDGAGWVDLSHRDVVAITGAERLKYLHLMTTQAFEGLGPGVVTDALLLSPQGHIEHSFSGVDDGITFLAHTEPRAGEALVSFLEQMKFALQVESTLVTGALAVVQHGRSDVRTIQRSDLVGYREAHGAPSGLWAAEALRIEDGRARVGLDNDQRTIPNEIGLLGTAVHLDKGCYRGQETVARVHTLGRPPRRLVLLHLDGSVDHLPRRRSDVVAGDRVVGFVGSAARHHELGPIALAVVKRNVPVDATLLADGVAAAQEVLVDPEAGLHVRPNLRG